jgi:hypothetical protein
MERLAIILGAGFSAPVGYPLAAQIFDEFPQVDRMKRQQLVSAVRSDWLRWKAEKGGMPEEYLAYLEQFEKDRTVDGRFTLASQYVALHIAWRTGDVRLVGGQWRLVRHQLSLQAPGMHEAFWNQVLAVDPAPTVITTNYDILAERGLRTGPMARPRRPGFRYGSEPTPLEGRGFPLYPGEGLVANGRSKLLKLHGSISWAATSGGFVPYADCRPAVKGEAFIVAPTKAKRIPAQLEGIWQLAEESLKEADKWLVVGYSLPAYDEAMQQLIKRSSRHAPAVSLVTRDGTLADRFDGLVGHKGSRFLGSMEAAVPSLWDSLR